MIVTRSTLNTAIPGMDGYRTNAEDVRREKKAEMEEYMWLYKG